MKVEDYARTVSGDIGIIINCPEQLKRYYGNWLWLETINEQRPIRNEDVIKSSPNIIDLIEVGDYVNGYQVLDIAEEPKRVLYLNDISQKGALIPRKNIKSIVTKEQFSSMEYKVGE